MVPYDLIKVKFSDGFDTIYQNTTIISQTWNQDLWCITFKETPSVYIPMLGIWTHVYKCHVYRSHPTDTNSFDLVFKVDMTYEHKYANCTFNQVHVCTTSSQAHYHLITTNTKSALFNGSGYLITLGTDNTVTVDRFRKIQHPEQQWITRLLTYGPHVYLYYRADNHTTHVISRGNIPLYSNKGTLLKGRDKRIKYTTFYSFCDAEHISSSHGHVHINNHILYIWTYRLPSVNFRNVFDSHRTLDLVTGESTILNTYIRDLKYPEYGPYPEYVAFDKVDNGYFIFEHDYSINGIGIGSGPDAGHRYSEWLLTNHSPGDTNWVNPKLSYLKPDGTKVNVTILSAFVFDRFCGDTCIAVLSESVVSIEFSSWDRSGSVYTTIFYHFDRTLMTLTPITMTQHDMFAYDGYSIPVNGIVMFKNEVAVLQPHVPNPCISALNEYLPVELVDIIHAYNNHTVPPVLYHGITKLD